MEVVLLQVAMGVVAQPPDPIVPEAPALDIVAVPDGAILAAEAPVMRVQDLYKRTLEVELVGTSEDNSSATCALVSQWLACNLGARVKFDAAAANAIDESMARDNVMLRMAGNSQHVAKRAGVDRKKFCHTVTLHAASCLVAWAVFLQSSLSSLIAAVRKASGRLLVFFVSTGYDETPMECVVNDEDEAAEDWVPAEFSPAEIAAWKKIVNSQRGDTSTKKLLQTSVVVGALVRVGEDDVLFDWNVPNPYQALSRADADCHYDALEGVVSRLGVDDHAEQFEHQARLARTDAHPSCALVPR